MFTHVGPYFAVQFLLIKLTHVRPYFLFQLILIMITHVGPYFAVQFLLIKKLMLDPIFFSVYPPDVFVGASDTDVEGQYTWIDGLPVTGQWGIGHPNNEADLDCVALGKLLSYDFTEVDCMAALSFLCQIKL